MTEPSRSAGPTLVPYFGYRDAAAALRWLAEAFGFEEKQARPFLRPTARSCTPRWPSEGASS